MTKLSWLPEFTVHSCLMATAHVAYTFQLTYYCWYLSVVLAYPVATINNQTSSITTIIFLLIEKGGKLTLPEWEV